jgi:hypothetical protein
VLAKAARFIAFAVAVGVVAAPASARSTGIGFSFLPQKVVQGDDARVAVSVRPSGARCTLGVRYQGGTAQPGLAPTLAAGGRASWTWRVPADVQAGPAAATVRCSGAGSVHRGLMIVGRKVEPKITVTKQGFSSRPNPGAGTRLSYGLILHNDAPKDALNVSVQVNFVMADNHLLGTDSQTISGIAAHSDYALGKMVNFPGLAPITRLEVVIQVQSYAAPSGHAATLANMHLVPEIFGPSWVGTVEGEIQNTDPVLSLQSANLSAVIFDADGNVLGGGSGFEFQLLPPGTRAAVILGMGFDAIPIDKAASAMVSLTTSWKQPGS